jgi:hypothetical protein
VCAACGCVSYVNLPIYVRLRLQSHCTALFKVRVFVSVRVQYVRLRTYVRVCAWVCVRFCVGVC